MGSKVIKLSKIRTCTTCEKSIEALRTKGFCGKCFGYSKYKLDKEKVKKYVKHILKEERKVENE